MNDAWVYHDSLINESWKSYHCKAQGMNDAWVYHDSLSQYIVNYWLCLFHQHLWHRFMHRCSTLSHSCHQFFFLIKNWKAHIYLWHDSFIGTPWHDSVICVTWLICTCGMTDSYVIWLTCTCDMTPSYVWHDLSTRVACLIHTCDLTHSYLWHDAFVCVTWLMQICDMTHMCDMTALQHTATHCTTLHHNATH